MSDLNDLIKRFSAGNASADKPEPSPAQQPLPRPRTKPAAKAPVPKPSADKAAPPRHAPKDEVWELPGDIRSGGDTPVIRTPSRRETPSEPVRAPEPVVHPPRPAAEPERAPARPPLRGGHVGRVLELQTIPEEEVPPPLTRWFTSLLTGAPYTPSKTGVIFYLQPDDEDDADRVYRVTAYGSLGLTNHMRLCVQGHSESAGSLVAHRIQRDASVDPAHPDWTPVRDRRSRSALSQWLLIIGVGLLVWLLLSQLILPLIAWIIAYGGEILTWVIVIVILAAVFGGFGRGRRRWF